MKMIEPNQTQLIHIAKAQCGIPDDRYRAIIAGQTKGKKTSSKDLTYFEADAVINYFVKTLGFKVKSNYIRTSGAARRQRWSYANAQRNLAQSPSPFPPPQGGRTKVGVNMSNVVSLASRDQLDLIDALAGQIAWKYEDGFNRWLAKYIKVTRITTAIQASRAIEGLKGMLKNVKREG